VIKDTKMIERAGQVLRVHSEKYRGVLRLEKKNKEVLGPLEVQVSSLRAQHQRLVAKQKRDEHLGNNRRDYPARAKAKIAALQKELESFQAEARKLEEQLADTKARRKKISHFFKTGYKVLRNKLALSESMLPEIYKGELPNVSLPDLQELIEWPTVDIISVSYNSGAYISNLLKALRKLDYPIEKLHFYFVDNASRDYSGEILAHASRDLPRTFIKNSTNTGFTGGNNVAMRVSTAKYIFLLNIDAAPKPDALKKLVMRAEQERGAGIVEAAQMPIEHPKWFDPKTQETSYSSGACMLIKRTAMQHTGVFDEKFFMYCEDVDLSWRMWSLGYRCIYEPRAKVWHEQGVTSIKGGLRTYYLIFRNGLMMRYIYGGRREYLKYVRKMLRLIVLQTDHPPASKRQLLRALTVHIKYWPHMIRRRRVVKKYSPNENIKFYGWDYSLRKW